MRVNTIQTVEFGSSRGSIQQANEAREATFEKALSDAERVDDLRSDQAAEAAETDELHDRRTDELSDESDEPEPGSDDDPDDKARDKDDDAASDARRYDTGPAPDFALDVATIPTGPVGDRSTATGTSHAGGSKKGSGTAAEAVARSARSFATQPLASTPVAGLGGEAAAAPTAIATPHSASPTQTAAVDALHATTTPDSTAPAGDEGRTTAASDPTTDTRGKPLTAKTSSARFIDPRTLQAIEAQRESVFRQIAMRITPEGGEMRVRLDPPELGELDVQMVVEKGSTMRMLVVAERPEMADLLERHLDELRHTLEQQGITVSDASIHARGDHDARSSLFGGSSDQSGGEPFEESDERDSATAPSRGYITSEGLDFWV